MGAVILLGTLYNRKVGQQSLGNLELAHLEAVVPQLECDRIDDLAVLDSHALLIKMDNAGNRDSVRPNKSLESNQKIKIKIKK